MYTYTHVYTQVINTLFILIRQVLGKILQYMQKAFEKPYVQANASHC